MKKKLSIQELKQNTFVNRLAKDKLQFKNFDEDTVLIIETDLQNNRVKAVLSMDLYSHVLGYEGPHNSSWVQDRDYDEFYYFPLSSEQQEYANTKLSSIMECLNMEILSLAEKMRVLGNQKELMKLIKK